jgi:GMP synthase (glutamine-hydrolysing)
VCSSDLKAIGKRLTAVFVDTGFMRLNEPELVRKAFENILDLRMVDASERFYARLAGVTDPEQKRRIIGEQFIREFEAVARGVGAEVLVQGTIYPDRVESASTSNNASKIKSHHNVAGLPKDMELRVYEPLRDLYKDEVRAIASKLGLPQEIVQRHPFPGPGLAIRILGEPTRGRAEILKRADGIVIQEIRKAGLYEKTWQAFAVLLPVKSVGVQGDSRTYGNTIAIRAVDSVDGMTANFSKIPWPVLEAISTRITNEVREVNRVVYDITHKPPGTIEWE